MKKYSLLFLICFSFTGKAQTIFDFKKDMVWISKANLYVCKYEVTNIEYRQFTDELLKDTVGDKNSKTTVYSCYPDTMVWVNQFQNHMGDGMYQYYRWLPAFDGYPVVGVSYEGAIKYCEWLTEKYGNGEYKFRLPTQEEFIRYAYVPAFKIAGGIESPITDEQKYLINYKPNIVNLDDSVSKVFYNPRDKTFMRVHNDTTKETWDNWGVKPYTHHVVNYLNGYLYIGLYKKRYTYKVEDSLTFYIKETNTYMKVQPVFNTTSNYYNDGFMYTSPSRAMKSDIGVQGIGSNGVIDPDYKTIFISGKSSFPADKNGLFDIAGNVSEMVLKKGYAMGGNWDSEVEEINYDYVFECKAPNVLVGFRVVAERIKY